MPDAKNTARVEPTLGTNPTAPSVEELRAAVESVPPAPPAAATAAEPAPMVGERLDQLSRIEDKTARIEEKYARTETGMLRVQDKVEAAMARMTDAALQSDLVVVRERVEELGRRVRSLPGLNSLWLTAIVTALLTAVFVLVAQKYLLGRLPG
jgi:polyhydroxyalkanoate synthesis regulator phasin